MTPEKNPSAPLQRGYSIIELLVVVAIVGMISLVVAPNFYTMYQSGKMKTSVRDITADLRNTRQQAATRNERWKVSFDTGGEGVNTYTVFQEQRNPTTGVRTWVQKREKKLHDVVYFASTNFPEESASDNSDDDGTNDVIFLPDGTIGNWPLVGGNLAPTARITIRTNLNIPKPQIVMNFSLTGNVKAQ